MKAILRKGKRALLRLRPFAAWLRQAPGRLPAGCAALARAVRGSLHRCFPSLEDRAIGREAMRHLRRSFVGPTRQGRSPDCLRVVIVNHFYEQDIDAFCRAQTDCTIWILDHSHVTGVRRYYVPPPFRDGDYHSPVLQAQAKRARRYFAAAAVNYVLARARPDVVIIPSDLHYWVRPFIHEFQARGIPVAVQDKEGTLSPGPLTEENLALTVDNVPPIGDRYYFWGPVQYQAWTRAGMDPARIRVLGMPRSDFFYHPDRHPSLESLGVPAGKRLITCFTYESNVYLTADIKGRNIGRPWLTMRQEMHNALKRLAALRPDVYIVVKCHPQSDELPEIQRELADAPANLTVMYGSVTGASLIVNSAVVIGFQTTALIETMLTKLPIIYTGWAQDHARYLDWLIPTAASGGCFLPESAEAMLTLIQQLLDRQVEVPPAMLRCRGVFTRRYFEDTRGSAADRVLTAIAHDLVARPVPLRSVPPLSLSA